MPADTGQSQEKINYDITLTKQQRHLYRKPTAPKRGYKRTLTWLLALPVRLLLFPITLPLSLLVTRILTASERHGLKTFYEDEKMPENGHWEYFQISSDKNPAHATKVNMFKLNQPTHKLHINVHGMQGSANDYDDLAAITAEQFGADQWNITRHASWTVESQKRQLRRVFAAAIVRGYKDVRFEGFSIGAAVVRTVCYDMFQDEKYRRLLKDNNIVLHYTARNGYISEGMTLGGILTGHGFRANKQDYVDYTGKVPKPNIIMWVMHKFLHTLSLVDFSLRNRHLHGQMIPNESRNYVISSVVSGRTRLKRDPVIAHHNRTNSVTKYGHVCLDVAAANISPDAPNHVIGLQPDVFKEANNQIKRDLALDETSARLILNKIQAEICGTPWSNKKGSKVKLLIPGEEAPKTVRVPKHVKKQLDCINENKLSPVLQLLQVRAIGKNGHEKTRGSKDDVKTNYYESFKSVDNFYAQFKI